MTALHAASIPKVDHARINAPRSLRLQRLLPGPIERAWSCLVDACLRGQWLAGVDDMPARVGDTFALVWRNDTLTDPPGQRTTATMPSTPCTAR